MRFFLIVLAFLMSGCTDAAWDSEISSYNETFYVDCYSGGQKIYEATTTGKVGSLTGGGWAFRTTDGYFVQTFADCFVKFKK